MPVAVQDLETFRDSMDNDEYSETKTMTESQLEVRLDACHAPLPHLRPA